VPGGRAPDLVGALSFPAEAAVRCGRLTFRPGEVPFDAD
jgi:hypothetical protein